MYNFKKDNNKDFKKLHSYKNNKSTDGFTLNLSFVRNFIVFFIINLFNFTTLKNTFNNINNFYSHIEELNSHFCDYLILLGNSLTPLAV